MAMAALARHEPGRTHPLSQIAESQRLPLPYLEQIFIALRRAQLVESARGRSGGYKLARPAGVISVADVLTAVAEDTHFTRCEQEAGCLAGTRCITHGLWQGLSDVTAGYLASHTLADVVAGAAPQAPKSSSPQARSYLDYNATAPLRAEARAAMIAALDICGNASSVHAEGRKARAIVETAREQVAALAGAKPSEVVFTSGASEANAWALSQGYDTIFVPGVEHESILAPARASGARLIDISCGSDGIAAIEDVARHWLTREGLGRALVTLQMANNETGVMQPVTDLAGFAREHGLSMHTDAVQAAGRIAIDFTSLPVTTLSLSAHKMGGPKGVGALIVRDHVDLVPLLRGGGQERRRRAGTENIAAIAGFGAAAAAARMDMDDMARVAQLRETLEREVRMLAPGAVIVGETSPRLANTSCIAFPGRANESLVIKFDLAGIAVSAGSACSSGKVGASPILTAMGLEPAIANGAIRISLGHASTQGDIAAFLAALKTIIARPALAA